MSWRIVRLPSTPPITAVVPLGSATVVAGLWTGDGPPDVVPGAKVGDEYLDMLTGDIYELREG